MRGLATRYRNLRSDARILTSTLELAAAKLSQAARQLEPTGSPLIKREPITAAELREWSSECARIAHSCGVRERQRGR